MESVIARGIEPYAALHSQKESPLLRALAKETYAKTSWPQMQVGHLEGLFLKNMVRLSRARRVLEIGTFTGYSTLSMAEGLPRGGKIITCDIDPDTTAIALKFWRRSPHGKKIELRLGPAARTLKGLKGPFDLVFIDADKENYIQYWNLCVPMLRRGGVLLADNVLWSGRVLSPKDRTDRAISLFNRHVARDPRVEAVMLTVRDGVTMAYKK